MAWEKLSQTSLSEALVKRHKAVEELDGIRLITKSIKILFRQSSLGGDKSDISVVVAHSLGAIVAYESHSNFGNITIGVIK